MAQKLGPRYNNAGDYTLTAKDKEDEISMDLDPFLLFKNAIRSEQTKRKYQERLKTFFDFISIPDCNIDERCNIFVQNSKSNPKYAMHYVFRFIIYQKERINKNEIVVSTIYNYLKPIKLLCTMNDININWKKLTSGLPKEKKYADDRAPTVEEIKRLLDYPDRRIKTIVLTMISSGMRLGAWNYLQYKNIQPINREGNIIASKIIIYAGTDEQYTTFITKEAYHCIEEWMDFRRKSNEEVSGESWIVRNLWDVTTPSGGPRGLASSPKKLKDTGVKSLIQRALKAQGIRTELETGKKRYEFATDHGMRKFFKTRCEIAGMRSLTVEYLLNHSTGITDSYFRPTENELLDDYLKAAENSLTIYQRTNQTIAKELEKERAKMSGEQNRAFDQLRAEFDCKIQQLLLKIDAGKMNF